MEAAETVLMAFGPIGMVVAAGVGFAYAALRPLEPSRKSKGVTQEYVRQEMQALTRSFKTTLESHAESDRLRMAANTLDDFQNYLSSHSKIFQVQKEDFTAIEVGYV